MYSVMKVNIVVVLRRSGHKIIITENIYAQGGETIREQGLSTFVALLQAIRYRYCSNVRCIIPKIIPTYYF